MGVTASLYIKSTHAIITASRFEFNMNLLQNEINIRYQALINPTSGHATAFIN